MTVKCRSLASRLAHLFMTEVVDRCQYGIDLHTGSNHRANLPQIRADLDNSETRRLAAAFGAPMMIQSSPIKGSLRSAASQRGVHVLVYEAGEPLRFNTSAITAGVQGVMNVLDAIGMWPHEGPVESGLVIGYSRNPLSHQGDALIHIARV